MSDRQDNRHALHDHKLSPLIRGFIAINSGPATETMAIREAGFMPTLYARRDGRACQIVLVSSMGDLGVRYDQSPDGYGYTERSISAYDLTDYSLERPADLPDAKPQPVYHDVPPTFTNRHARRKAQAGYR